MNVPVLRYIVIALLGFPLPGCYQPERVVIRTVTKTVVVKEPVFIKEPAPACPTNPDKEGRSCPPDKPPQVKTLPCPPLPAGDCNRIRTADACQAEKRCEWVDEHERKGRPVKAYCRRLPAAWCK